ncbi:MAG: permease [Dehalococcoidia bacterium]|nr:permease [Dehalococcoidia bacterium]
MKRNNIIKLACLSGYALFILASFVIDFHPGKEGGLNLAAFSLEMLKILPCAFILVGLFEVWVKRETVEKHFGERSTIKGYLWAVLLAGTTVGGLYVAFPIAYYLYSKGAKLGVVLTYMGAAAICRIPMALFEASFLGIKFTATRLLVSLPLVVISSMLLGHYLTRRGYKVTHV